MRSPLDNIERLIQNINNKNRIYLHYGDLRDLINNVGIKCKARLYFPPCCICYPKTSFDAPLDTYETNISGTSTLLEAIKNFSKNSQVHVCASFRGFWKGPKKKHLIDEECSFHPASPYAISKVGTDLIGRYYAEAFNMNVQTTRMFTHTGLRRGDVFLLNQLLQNK